MAYSNEDLTEEEKELIIQTGHRRFTAKTSDGKELYCTEDFATLDREKKIWLMRYPRDISYEPSLKEDKFVIFWGRIHKDNLIEICLKDLDVERDDKINAFYRVELIQYWAVKSVKIPKELNITKEAVIKELEDIMTGYAFSGFPEENRFRGKIKVMLKEYEYRCCD